MAIKKKDFLKLYADSMDNVSGDGVWSGRSIGIPIAGAMFGGDDYKEKIGREKIPWYLSDFRGQSSMAADAGFSSIVMSRVNKGRDDEIYSPTAMFPDQDVKEPVEDDNYILRSSNQGDGTMKKENAFYFNEDLAVKNSQYSLVTLDNLVSEQVDFDWKKIVPGNIKDAAEETFEDVSWRDFVPDSLEDEAEEAYDAVASVLSRGRDAGKEAYGMLEDKLEKLTKDSETFEDVKSAALEIGRDFLALTLAGIPVIGTPVAATYVLYNMSELDAAEADAQAAIDLLLTEGTYNHLEDLQRISGLMFDDYIDMLQASTYLIPFVGASGKIVKTAGRLLNKTRAVTAASFMGLAGGSILKSAIKSEILLSNVFKFVANLADSEVIDALNLDRSLFFNTINNIPATLIVMSDIIEAGNAQFELHVSEGKSPETFRFDTSKMGLHDESLAGARQRILSGDYSAGISEWIEQISEKVQLFVMGEETQLAEANMKKNDILREFIKETVYHELSVTNPALPGGFEYRRPPSSEESSDRDTGSLDNLVNYKTDMGYATYQARPEDLEELKEEALRRIIRRKLQESLKKKN